MPNERNKLYKTTLIAQLTDPDKDFPVADLENGIIDYNDIKDAIREKGVSPSSYISYDIDLLIIKLSSLRASGDKVDVHFMVNPQKELTVAFRAHNAVGAPNEPLPYDFGDVHQ